jgi:predicted RNase H-like HicB family nuclease
MKLKVVVHSAEEGGYWAEVPAIAGCATQGETLEELFENLHEAIEGCLSVDVRPVQETEDSRILEITI